MILRTDIAETSGTNDPTLRLLCRIPGDTPPHVESLLATGRAEVLCERVCRSALLYTALFSTLEALAVVDQMRIPSVLTALGRSPGGDDSTVQLACWFRIGHNLRVLVSPRFTTMGDAIVVGCSHAILFMQPWMDQHPLDSNSWWLSLAEHSYTHFHGPHSLYHRPAEVFASHKADGRRTWMYYGDHSTAVAARTVLGPVGRALGAKTGKTFYPAGPPERRVAFSDTNQSFVSFVADEWPFDPGSPPVVIINAFMLALGHEIAGLRARLQRDSASAP